MLSSFRNPEHTQLGSEALSPSIIDRSTKLGLNGAMRLAINERSIVTVAPRPPSPRHGRLNQNRHECYLKCAVARNPHVAVRPRVCTQWRGDTVRTCTECATSASRNVRRKECTCKAQPHARTTKRIPAHGRPPAHPQC
eukprot:3798849-Alexandrium_andersonii.AAC.1